TSEVQFVPDMRKEQDFTSSQIIGDPIILSKLCAPIKVNSTVIGVINIESERLNAFDENDKKILETLAEHVASSYAIILEKEKLRKSLRELENLNRELDEYTYIVSHDLKAPLRSIQAFSEFLLDSAISKLDDDEKDYLEKVIGASKRMTELIEDLLLLSRVNRKFLDVELVDLNEMIKEIEVDLQSLISEKGAEVLCDDLPKINGHRVWLKQLFSNLINNGLKFNESSTPMIHVGFEEHYNYYIFNVKDNGIGIEEEDYENIFKLFQRLHPQDKYPGTGAGLTICKKIVESYGGRIWLESRHGLGSTFYFTIPKNVFEEGTPGSPPILEEYARQGILE
ncbi:MAG: ATP-binding protein, partial [Candidatus Bathyarchaeota archaeon]|nr:ATP-binding protein [Candidatus Bathyarchaeota archaeon]